MTTAAGPGAEVPPTVMWEVRAADGRAEELLAFVLAGVDATAQVFRSADGPPRIVVLDPTGVGVAEPPDGLVARPPHAWNFLPVDRNRSATGDVIHRVGLDAGPGDGPRAGSPDGPEASAGKRRPSGGS